PSTAPLRPYTRLFRSVSGSITTAAIAGTTSIGVVASNNALTFTDARQNAGASDPAITVNFIAGAGTAARSIAVTGTTINVTLATDRKSTRLNSSHVAI